MVRYSKVRNDHLEGNGSKDQRKKGRCADVYVLAVGVQTNCCGLWCGFDMDAYGTLTWLSEERDRLR